MRHFVATIDKTLCGLKVTKTTQITISDFRCDCVECLEALKLMTKVDDDTAWELYKLKKAHDTPLLKRGTQ